MREFFFGAWLANHPPQARQVMQTESPASLQTGQRLVFDAVVQHYRQILSGKCSFYLMSFKFGC